jgi:glycosyltransferase involved in cell wall biosynthesis
LKISIALATYNGENYLTEQLQSYVSQIRLPDELIICDDVSSDGTLAILTEFQKVAPFKVQIIKNEKNLGYTNNFGKALSLCTGDIVFFSDQDDVWLDNKISTVIGAFDKNPNISVIIHDAELVNENLESTGLTKLGQIIAGGHTERSFVTGTLSAIKKDLLAVILPFPANISGGHDGWVHSIAGFSKRKLVIKDSLQKLRRHSDNTSEWVIASLQKVNKLDVFKAQLSTQAADSYADRRNNNLNLLERFNKVKLKQIHVKFKIDFEKIEKQLNDELASINRRQSLISRGFLARKLYAVKLLTCGDYRCFNGYRSFLRDFLR